MSKVTVIDHPLVQHKLALLRDKETGTKAFRELVSELAMLMGYEVTRGAGSGGRRDPLRGHRHRGHGPCLHEPPFALRRV